MTSLFPSNEFDDWAAGYDESVTANSTFPFTGYSTLLQTIFEKAACPPGSNVLDLGIGTGNLALLFDKADCKLWGLDFSAEMLKLAQKKLPSAVLGKVDLRADWPPAINRRFEAIVSAYTFHHFTLEEKISLVKRLLSRYLIPGGKLLIGDIAFENIDDEIRTRDSLGEEWEQEYYWLADESLEALRVEGVTAAFHKISYCAGIFEITNQATS
jgi:putative AdoMet-dependent methyltransferase